MQIEIGGAVFGPEGAPHIVGVVNLSPESPNRDSIVASADGAVARARRLVADGAAVIDVGAQSSHFAAPLLPESVEIERLRPTIAALKSAGMLVSVDTWRPAVAHAAIEAGIDILNDSDGFQDPELIELIAASGLPIILPFISGASPHDPVPFDLADPMPALLRFFEGAIERASKRGVTRIILDPGTGYVVPGITPQEKVAYQRIVYARLGEVRALGFPVLVALPRKPDPCLTRELVGMIIANGADWVRAHEPALAVAARATLVQSQA